MRIRQFVRVVVDYLKDNATIKWLFLPLTIFGAATLMFPAPFLIKWESFILAAIAFVVAITYLGSVIDGLRTQGRMPRYTHLALGIFLGWLSIVMNRTWVGVLRFYPLETWMRDSYFIAFYVYTTIMAGVFHLTAPGAIDGVVPKENWVKIGVTLTLGILLGIACAFFLIALGVAEVPTIDVLIVPPSVG